MLRTHFAILLLCLARASAAFSGAETRQNSRPNIVVVLADDLGYGDLGCYGNTDLHTPHIDQFAADGLLLTDCYSAHPNCSPSRAGLMTGRTPFRVGIYNWIPMFSPMHVRESEITIATLLRDSGYDTCHVGKWHLNGDFNLPSQPQPGDHGFNHWYATQNNALPNHRDPDNFVRNGKSVGPQKGYSAQLVSREAAEWLTSGRDKSCPFFLFACFHEPHEPIASADEFTKLYPGKGPSYAAHHGNITQLDDGFGQLIATLDKLKLRENTLVIFTSDNGPAITGMHPHGSAGPLRDKKGAIYEGGIRVPGLIQWPGKIEGGRKSAEAVCGTDILPTLCELAGVDIPQDRVIDGVSIAPLFHGRPVVRPRPLYWQFNRARSEAKVAIRKGRWKMVAGQTPPAPNRGGEIGETEIEQVKSADLVEFQLFDLQSDIAESENVARSHPHVFAAMMQQMTEMHREIQTAAPVWPAWEWPRYESKRIKWPDYWLNRNR